MDNYGKGIISFSRHYRLLIVLTLRGTVHAWFSRRVSLNPSGMRAAFAAHLVAPASPLYDSSCGDSSRLSRVNPPPVTLKHFTRIMMFVICGTNSCLLKDVIP